MPWTNILSTTVDKGGFKTVTLTYTNPFQFVVRNNGLVTDQTINWGVLKLKRSDPAFAGGAYYYVSQPLYQGLQYATFSLPNYGTLIGVIYVNKGYFDLTAPIDFFQFT